MDLTVSGKNILDEGFSGANVRDKENNNKFSKSGAEFLLENIKKATTPVKNTGMRNKDAISTSISTIAQSLGDNTEAVQKIVDANDESQEEFVKLVKMMAAAQEKTGEASVAAINQLLQQIAKIEVKSGDNSAELTKLLGLDKTKETLMNQSNPLGLAGTAFKKFTNVDVRENETFGASLKQAFSKEKLFGLQPKNDFDTIKEQVSLEEKNKTQSQGFQETVNAAITTKPLKSEAKDQVVNAEGGKVFTAGIDRESLDNKKVELLEDILAELKNMSSGEAGGNGLGLPPGMDLRNGKQPTNTKPSRFSRLKRALGFADDVPTTGATATPTKSTAPRSLKSLLFGQADDVAKAGVNVADDVAKAGVNVADDVARAGTNVADDVAKAGVNVADDVAKAGVNVADDVAKAGVNVADDAVRGAASTTSRLGTAGKLLSKAAIPLTVGMGAYEGYTGYQDADQLVESGATNEETGQAFTEQDETAGKVEAVTSATGGVAGAIAGGSVGASYGATAGAAIGSLFFGVGAAPGAAIGSFLGGAIGGTLGYFGGSAAGEAIGDAATTTSGEAALDAAIESGLYDKDWVGNSEIDPEILKETTDTAQLQAILHDDDLSNDDKALVEKRIQELSGTIESNIPNPQGLEGEVLKEYQKLYAEEEANGGFYETREDQADLAKQARMIVDARNKAGNQTATPSVSTSTTTTDSSDDPVQMRPGFPLMGAGDIKGYNNQLESINDSDSSPAVKRMQTDFLDADFRSRFGGTPRDLEVRREAEQMQEKRSVTPSVSTNRNENNNAVDPKLKELNQKAVDAEIAYNENPSEENYKAMADATLKSDEYILENNVPNANELVNMAPSDPSRMLMTGSDSASGLERIETSVTPTADAVGNMTEASASQSSQQAPTVINNVTNNNTQASNSSPPVLINPTTARNSVNSFIEFQSRQYTRV
jgi:hypothetical protein